MFMIFALQQLFMPKLLVKNEPRVENGIDTDLMDRVRRLREDMVAAEVKAPPTPTKEAPKSISTAATS